MINPVHFKRLSGLGIFASLMALVAAIPAETLKFSGYTWVVRPAGVGGPGPNHWDPGHVWVDTNGWLHLKLAQRDGKWRGSEVYTRERLGFGRYQFSIDGPVDKLDRNIVLGLFNYPTSDVGPDATQEIDIEFAKWGNPTTPIGNYTIWPTTTKLSQTTRSFAFSLSDRLSTHSFTWSPTNVWFQSWRGHSQSNQPIASWVYQPTNPAARISQKPMPVHINLWCFKGQPPADGLPVELVVRSLQFTPLIDRR